MKILRRVFLKQKYRKCIIKTSLIKTNVKLGNKCEIYQNVQIDENCYIGCYALINQNVRIYSNTAIGNFVSIGPTAIIAPTEHPINLFTTHPISYEYNENKKISDNKKTIIGNDVWIGANAIIKRGVKIGNGAVIGAGAVVTKDVPPYAVIGGVPARIIKYRFDKKTIKKLLSMNWWYWDIKKIENDPYLKNLNQTSKE